MVQQRNTLSLTCLVLTCLASLGGCVVSDAPQDAPEIGSNQQAIGGAFHGSCWNIRLTNSCDKNSYCNLGASCRRRDGSVNDEAWWNLNNHIGNAGGFLTTFSSGFSNTCDNISIYKSGYEDHWLMRASCYGMNNEHYWDAEDLSLCLTNDDGNLKWVCPTLQGRDNPCPEKHKLIHDAIAAGLTVAELAAALGVTPQVIYQWRSRCRP